MVLSLLRTRKPESEIKKKLESKEKLAFLSQYFFFNLRPSPSSCLLFLFYANSILAKTTLLD